MTDSNIGPSAAAPRSRADLRAPKMASCCWASSHQGGTTAVSRLFQEVAPFNISLCCIRGRRSAAEGVSCDLAPRPERQALRNINTACRVRGPLCATKCQKAPHWLVKHGDASGRKRVTPQECYRGSSLLNPDAGFLLLLLTCNKKTQLVTKQFIYCFILT